eukprot:gene1420-12040_t
MSDVILPQQFKCRYEQIEGYLIFKPDKIEFKTKTKTYLTIAAINFESAGTIEKKLKIQLLNRTKQKYLLILLEADKFQNLVKVLKFFKDKSIELIKKLEEKPPLEEGIDVIKKKILQNNKNLQRIYDELVVTNEVLTPEQFWISNKKYLDFELSKKQSSGLKNSIISEIIEEQTACNSLKIRLTKNVKNNIFIQFPAVKKAYNLKVVTNSMSEQLFWQQFFKSHYFHRKKDFSKIQEPDMFETFEKDEELKSNEKITPLVDLNSTDSLEEGYGIRADEFTVPSKLDPHSNFLKKFNKQSTNIVNQIKLSNSKSLNQQLFDIEENEKDSFIPLNLPEKKNYLESYSSSVKSRNSTNKKQENELNSVEFLDEIKHYKTEKVIIPGDLSLKILNEIQENSKISNFDNEASDLIPIEFKEEFSYLYTYINELLFHYYDSINKDDWSKKKDKIINGIRKYYEKLIKLKDRYSHLQNLMRPTFDSIEKILGKDEDKIYLPMNEMAPIQFQLGKRSNEEEELPNKKVKF